MLQRLSRRLCRGIRWALAAGVLAGAADLAAQAPAAGTLPVAARDLARGVVLEAEDVSYVPRPADADAGEAVGPVVGWTTRRVLSAGEPLVAPSVAPPALVEANQKVEAVWRRGTLELRVAGQAMGSGALGDRVTVRIDTRRRVQGVVVGPGLVELDSSERSRK